MNCIILGNFHVSCHSPVTHSLNLKFPTMVKGSQTPGVKPMSISGRFTNDRDRLLGMTDEERAFRKQWLKDQHLAPNEPKPVPEIYKALHNPIRRFYRFPLEQFQKILTPALGAERALKIRYFTGKAVMGILAAYWITYYMKYNANDWTRYGGWRVLKSREAVFEGDPGYPKLSDRTKPSDYASRGFKDCKLDL